MKKTIIPILILLVAGTVFGQGTTNEKINAYAKELGVPVEELLYLIEKHHPKKNHGFSDPRAEKAEVIDVRGFSDVSSPTYKRKKDVYIIDPCWIRDIKDDAVVIEDFFMEYIEIVNNDTVISIPVGSLVKILVEYRKKGFKADLYPYYIIEIITY